MTDGETLFGEWAWGGQSVLACLADMAVISGQLFKHTNP